MAETNERSYFIDRTFTTTRMVRQRGIEPPALGLEVLCSIQLSYWRILVLAVGLEPTRYRYQRILSPPRLPIPPLRHMERVTGIEPASPAWKAGALAVVLHPHMVSSDGIEPPTLCL